MHLFVWGCVFGLLQSITYVQKEIVSFDEIAGNTAVTFVGITVFFFN